MKSKLNVVLAERRVTKRELARRLGVRPETVWRWSTDDGIGNVPLERLARIAEALGCGVADLYEE